MSCIEIVSGDDVNRPVQLYKDNQTFLIGGTANVQAAIVQNEKVVTQVTLQASDPGSNWGSSRVMLVMSASETENLAAIPSLLEVEVDDNGKLTWQRSIEIVQGFIE